LLVPSQVSKIFQRIHPWVMVLIFTLFYCLITLVNHNWNPFSFILIGKQFDAAHGVLEMGYDGQFVYQIALNPGGAAEFLDIPAYRYQRILYPLLARLTSLGIPSAIPWMLIVINIVSISLGTLATEKILKQHGKSRWYALVYCMFAGMLLSLRLDLTEPLAFALAQWGVWYFIRNRPGLSGLLLALAILTRELTILFAAACAITLFLRGEKIKGILWGIAVILPFGVWQIFLRVWLGDWGIGSGGAMATAFEIIPFRGWWGFPAQDMQIFALLSIFILTVALIPASAAIYTGLRKVLNRQFGLGVWLLLLNAGIFPFLPSSNVLNLPGLLRITTGLVVAVLDYGALESSNRALRFSLLCISW